MLTWIFNYPSDVVVEEVPPSKMMLNQVVPSKLVHDAVQYFGITSDPHRGGWILPSGEFLDFSSDNLRRLYNDPRRCEMTSDDKIRHWEISKVVGLQGEAGMRRFENHGCIRFRKTPGRGMFVEMTILPTRLQVQTIVESMFIKPYPVFLVLQKVHPNPKHRGELVYQDFVEEKLKADVVESFLMTVFEC